MRIRAALREMAVAHEAMTMTDERQVFNNGNLRVLILGRQIAQPQMTLRRILRWNLVINDVYEVEFIKLKIMLCHIG